MKKIIKWLFISIIFICVLPFGLSARLLYIVFKSTVLFELFAQTFSLVPGFFGPAVRASFYKQTLAQSHLDLFVAFGGLVSKIDTKIGRSVTIAAYASVGLADLDDGAAIGNGVSVLSGAKHHNFDDPEKGIFETEAVFTRISIGKNVFIGDKAVVMANIGEKTIIGAGSIVVKDIPSYSIAVGNPARVIKDRRS